MAVLWAKHHGLKEVIIETDAQVLVSRLSSAVLFHSDLDAILGDIVSLCSWFNVINFSHVRRDGNAVAHYLAKVVPFGYEQRWKFHCPSVVSPYVLMELMHYLFPLKKKKVVLDEKKNLKRKIDTLG